MHINLHTYVGQYRKYTNASTCLYVVSFCWKPINENVTYDQPQKSCLSLIKYIDESTKNNGGCQHMDIPTVYAQTHWYIHTYIRNGSSTRIELSLLHIVVEVCSHRCTSSILKPVVVVVVLIQTYFLVWPSLALTMYQLSVWMCMYVCITIRLCELTEYRKNIYTCSLPFVRSSVITLCYASFWLLYCY